MIDPGFITGTGIVLQLALITAFGIVVFDSVSECWLKDDSPLRRQPALRPIQGLARLMLGVAGILWFIGVPWWQQ